MAELCAAAAALEVVEATEEAAAAPCGVVEVAALERGEAGALLERFRAGEVCVVRLPTAATLEGLWAASEAGFEAAAACPVPLTRAEGQLEYGLRVHGKRSFLETRLESGSHAADADDGGGVRTRRCVPESPSSAPLLAAYDALDRIARAAIASCCEALGADPKTILDLLDGPATPLSASVLRLARYEADQNPKPRVVFGAHTDTSFVTVTPCAATPGLQVLVGGNWTWPEVGQDPNRDVLVFAGEFLQSPTREVHRVALAADDGPSLRFSAPFLCRARKDARLDVRPLHAGAEAKVMDLEGLTMGKFHRFLELRRRRLVAKHHEENQDAYLDPEDDESGFILA